MSKISSSPFRWIQFPDPKDASPEGIVATGGDLSPDMLYSAYSQGIFPWPHEGLPLLWFCPEPRGIIDFSELHIPKSLAKFLRKAPFKVTKNQAFRDVILACSKVPRKGQAGTWIDHEVIAAYCEFHRLGYAHSVEVWRGDQLVGGIYGVFVQNVFSAESMFHFETNASKVALMELISYLSEIGLKWIDVQMVTETVEKLGGKYISKKEFLSRLKTEGEKPEKKL